MVTYNLFFKKPDNKTGFELVGGSPIFSKTVYQIQPYYVNGKTRRAPDFSLVSQTGKHISSFYKVCGDFAYLGDHKKQALILFQKPNGFELFKMTISPIEAKLMLCEGRLNNEISTARGQS